MTANAILRELRKGPATLEGIQLRLQVSGDKVDHLQLMLDGLLLVGEIKITNTPIVNNQWWYALKSFEEAEWHPEDCCVIKEVLSKHPEKKLDWKSEPRLKLNPFAEVEANPKVRITDEQILSVIDHDAPSTIKIVHRLTNLLHRKPFEINFYEVKMQLKTMLAKGLVGYLKPTEISGKPVDGGWFKPRKKVARWN